MLRVLKWPQCCSAGCSCFLTFEIHHVLLLSDIPELDGSVLAGRGEHASALEGLDRGGVEAAVNIVELHVVHGAGVAAQRAEVVETRGGVAGADGVIVELDIVLAADGGQQLVAAVGSRDRRRQRSQTVLRRRRQRIGGELAQVGRILERRRGDGRTLKMILRELTRSLRTNGKTERQRWSSAATVQQDDKRANQCAVSAMMFSCCYCMHAQCRMVTPHSSHSCCSRSERAQPATAHLSRLSALLVWRPRLCFGVASSIVFSLRPD